MSRLDDITLEELHEVREQTEGEKPRERVLAAIGRKQGDQIDTLAERHGVVGKTIRNWLDRFAEQPIEQAPYDAPRPGGPSKLTTDQREHLEEVLHDPPTELGYDQQAWSSKLLLHYVACEYDVEYSKRHTRYLMTETGLPGGQRGLATTKPTPKRKPSSNRQSKKRLELAEKTIVIVDQFTKRVGMVQRHGWYPIGSDSTIETSNAWEKVTVLGAVTGEGESFYC